MNKKNFINHYNQIFKENCKFKTFLLSILITGLAYGIYKGMLDNFLVEIVGMSEMDRGITEFFREVPGILMVFILAIFYMLSAETLYKAGALIMLIGMAMNAVFENVTNNGNVSVMGTRSAYHSAGGFAGRRGVASL